MARARFQSVILIKVHKGSKKQDFFDFFCSFEPATYSMAVAVHLWIDHQKKETE